MSFCPGLLMPLTFEVQKLFITKVLSLPWVSKTCLKPRRPGTDFFGICAMLQQPNPKVWLPRGLVWRGKGHWVKKKNFFQKKMSAYQSKILLYLIVKAHTFFSTTISFWATHFRNMCTAFWTCVLNVAVFLYHWKQLLDSLKFNKNQIHCFRQTQRYPSLSQL